MYDFDKQQDGLASAWETCFEPKETVEEGILDRVKAKASNVSNTVKNVGASVKAGVQTLKGDTQGAKSTISGVESRKKTKVDIATDNYLKVGGKLDKQFNNFINDLIKLSGDETQKASLTNLSVDVNLKNELRDSLGGIFGKYQEAYYKKAQEVTPTQPTAQTTQPTAQTQTAQPTV